MAVLRGYIRLQQLTKCYLRVLGSFETSCVCSRLESSMKSSEQKARGKISDHNRWYRQPRIIIIGAGMAGIAAASALVEANFTDVIVLEAEDRLGGRVHSLEKDGRLFEVGAGWLHYTDTELHRICVESGFVEHATKSDDLILDHALIFSDREKPLRPIDCELVNDNLDIVDLLLPLPPTPTVAENTIIACNRSFGDIFLQKYTEITLDKKDAAHERQLKLAAVDLAARIVLDDFGASSLFDISLDVGHQEERGSGAYLTRLKVPLSHLTDQIRANVPENVFRRGCTVKQIQFMPNCSRPVELICEQNLADFSLSADHVIITISVGALKATHAELFRHSPLSNSKKMTIGSFGMGYMGSLFFQFPVDNVGKTWWQRNLPKWKSYMTIPTTESDIIDHNMPFAMHMVHLQPEVLECGLKFMLLSATRAEEQDAAQNCSYHVDPSNCRRAPLHKTVCNWTRYISGLYFFPVLQRIEKSDKFVNDHSWCKILLPGGVSHFVDSLDDERVVRDFSAFIRNMIGEADIPDALQVVRRCWGSEPRYCGSFSYPSVSCAKQFGSSGSDALGQPEWMYEMRHENSDGAEGGTGVMLPALLFAGEATSTTGLGYMHGAYDSGIREAKRLIEAYVKYSQASSVSNII